MAISDAIPNRDGAPDDRRLSLRPGPEDDPLGGKAYDAWAVKVAEPLENLRQEMAVAFDALRRGHDGGRRRSLYELAWRAAGSKKAPEPGGADYLRAKKHEAAWRRAVAPAVPLVDDPMVRRLARALVGLQAYRSRLDARALPLLCRLLDGSEEPARRFLNQVCGSDRVPAPRIQHMVGTWRVLHRRSDGGAYISWRLEVEEEAAAGLQGWFRMETRLGSPPGDAGDEAALSVYGGIRAIGSTVHLIGGGHKGHRTPLMMSVGLPVGSSPEEPIRRAWGVLVRTGNTGPYSARSALRRMPQDAQVRIGMIEAGEDLLPADLADDMLSLAGNETAKDLLRPTRRDE